MSIVHKITRFVMPCLKEHDSARNRLQDAFENLSNLCDTVRCDEHPRVRNVFTEQHLITNKGHRT